MATCTIQATQRVGVYLALMVVQRNDSGDLLVSLLPLPYGFAVLTTWLASLWVALMTLAGRFWLELDLLAIKAHFSLHLLAGLIETLAGRCHLWVTLLEVLVRALWWALW